MKYVISELSGHTLDRAVAVAMGWKIVTWGDRQVWVQASGEGRFRCNVADWKPSTNPAQAWPIIEKEKMGPVYDERDKHWFCMYDVDTKSKEFSEEIGSTALIAAMRAFVASKLGEEFGL